MSACIFIAVTFYFYFLFIYRQDVIEFVGWEVIGLVIPFLNQVPRQEYYENILEKLCEVCFQSYFKLCHLQCESGKYINFMKDCTTKSMQPVIKFHCTVSMMLRLNSKKTLLDCRCNGSLSEMSILKSFSSKFLKTIRDLPFMVFLVLHQCLFFMFLVLT